MTFRKFVYCIYLKNTAMKIRVFIISALMFALAGCAELQNALKTIAPVPLTEADVIAGLKEALTTGAKNSAQRLAAENGYYGDAAVKILLPPEARTIVDNISRLPGGEK